MKIQMLAFGSILLLSTASAPAPLVNATKIEARASGTPEMVLQSVLLPYTLALSADGQWLAGAAYECIQLWRMKDNVLWRSWPGLQKSYDEAGVALAFAPNGKQLLAVTSRGKGFTFDIATGKTVNTFQWRAFRNEGRHWFEGKGGALHLHETRSGRRLGVLRVTGRADFIDVAPDGSLVAISQNVGEGGDGKARLYNTRTGKLQCVLSDPRGVFGASIGVVGPTAFSPDGKLIATGGEDPDWKMPPNDSRFATDGGVTSHALPLKIWDAHTGKLLHVHKGFFDNAYGPELMRFLSERQIFVNGAVYDVPTGKKVRALQEKWGKWPDQKSVPQAPLAFSRDGKILASRDNRDQGIALWDVTTGRRRALLSRRALNFNLLQFSPDGRYFAAGGRGVFLWDLSSRDAFLLPQTGYEENLQFLAGAHLAVTNSQEVKIFDVATNRLLATPRTREESEKHTSEGFTVSPSGELWGMLEPLSSDNYDKYKNARRPLQLRDMNGQSVGELPEFGDDNDVAQHTAWSEDGKYMAYGSYKNKDGIRLWNVATRQFERTFTDPTGSAHGLIALALSPDGKTLAGVSFRNNRVLVWDVPSGHLKRIMAASSRATFSRNGALLALSSSDRVCVYDLKDKNGAPPKYQITLQIADHGIAFSSDGKVLAAATSKGILFFDAATGKPRLTLLVTAPEASIENVSSSGVAGWLAFTPEGYFDASPAGEKLLKWRVNGQLVPAAQLPQRRRTNLISAVLARYSATAPINFSRVQQPHQLPPFR